MNKLVQLCAADAAVNWPRLAWTDFAANAGRARALVIVPLCGFADWGVGGALDVEEMVALHVLRGAVAARPSPPELLVLPPLRFVAGPVETCAFAIEADLALALIGEVVGSIASAGFRRVVLYNASPWNEELCETAARDLRVGRGLEMFCVHLGALGLDFRARHDGDRARLRAVVEALETNNAAAAESALGPAGAHMRRLLDEIAARPPLPRDGAIALMTPP